MIVDLASNWLRTHKTIRILLRVLFGFGRIGLMMTATSLLFPGNDATSILNMAVLSFCLVGFIDTTIMVHILRDMDRDEKALDREPKIAEPTQDGHVVKVLLTVDPSTGAILPKIA